MKVAHDAPGRVHPINFERSQLSAFEPYYGAGGGVSGASVVGVGEGGNTQRAHQKRSTVMKPLEYDIQEEHNSETKQMDLVLTYNGTSPSQTIRIPMHEAISIMMAWLSGYSQAYPMLLKMNPAYEEFAANMQRLQDK